MMTVFRFIPVLLLLIASHADAVTCDDLTSLESWQSSMHSERTNQTVYFSQLKDCLFKADEYRESIDTIAVLTAQSLEMDEEIFPEIGAKAALGFIAQSLRLNAEVGFPSSMHNYAVLFNAPPGGVMARNIPQNYTTFMQWTRKAASKGEPRAMFNLAMRLAKGVSKLGITRDPQRAYQLLLVIEGMVESDNDNERLKAWYMGIRPHIIDTKAEIYSEIGKAETQKLTRSIKSIQLKDLAKP